MDFNINRLVLLDALTKVSRAVSLKLQKKHLLPENSILLSKQVTQ